MTTEPSKNVSLVVLGLDLLSSTLLSPFLKDTITTADGNNVSVNWCVAVYGVHAFDVGMVRRADGIIVVFPGDQPGNFARCKEMCAPLPQFCPPDVPILGVAVVKAAHELSKSVVSQARQYFGQTLRSMFVNFVTNDRENCGVFMQQFVGIAQTRSSNPRVFVRALRDNDVPNSYDFKKSDVFVLEQPVDSARWCTGNFLGFVFMFLEDYTEVVRDPNKERETTKKLSIPRTLKAKNSKEVFTVYEIEAESTKNLSWKVSKRFSDLFDFYVHLQQAYADAQLPPFPGKALMNTAALVEQRRVQIEKCLQAALQDPSISFSGILDQFLDLDKQITTKLQQEQEVRRATILQASGGVRPPTVPPPAAPKTPFPVPEMPELQGRASYLAPVIGSNTSPTPAQPPAPLSSHSTPAQPAPEETADSKEFEVAEPEYHVIHCHKFVQATYEFASREEGELSFAAGDIIEVYAELDSGWAYGSVFTAHDPSAEVVEPEVFGTFPSNYAEPLADDQLLPNQVTVGEQLRKQKAPQMITVVPGDCVTFPVEGQSVAVRYSAYFLDGMEFDSSYGSGGDHGSSAPIYVKVGSTHMAPHAHVAASIPAFHESLHQLSVGQRVILTVFPSGGWGPRAADAHLSPQAVLNFDLELVAVSEDVSEIGSRANSVMSVPFQLFAVPSRGSHVSQGPASPKSPSKPQHQPFSKRGSQFFGKDRVADFLDQPPTAPVPELPNDELASEASGPPAMPPPPAPHHHDEAPPTAAPPVPPAPLSSHSVSVASPPSTAAPAVPPAPLSAHSVAISSPASVPAVAPVTPASPAPPSAVPGPRPPPGRPPGSGAPAPPFAPAAPGPVSVPTPAAVASPPAPLSVAASSGPVSVGSIPGPKPPPGRPPTATQTPAAAAPSPPIAAQTTESKAPIKPVAPTPMGLAAHYASQRSSPVPSASVASADKSSPRAPPSLRPVAAAAPSAVPTATVPSNNAARAPPPVPNFAMNSGPTQPVKPVFGASATTTTVTPSGNRFNLTTASSAATAPSSNANRPPPPVPSGWGSSAAVSASFLSKNAANTSTSSAASGPARPTPPSFGGGATGSAANKFGGPTAAATTAKPSPPSFGAASKPAVGPTASAAAGGASGACSKCDCKAFTKNVFKPTMCQCGHDVGSHA